MKIIHERNLRKNRTGKMSEGDWCLGSQGRRDSGKNEKHYLMNMKILLTSKEQFQECVGTRNLRVLG
jgi:hypothetical protein